MGRTQVLQQMINTALDIPSFYTVSDDGRVYSKYTNKYLSPKIDKYGYKVLCLRVNGANCHITIHRLVALVYIPNPDGKPQINHKDGNKLNNSLGNLEWCTAKENTQHAYDNGLAKAWNKGLSGIYTQQQLDSNINNQPHRKQVHFMKDGVSYSFRSLREAERITGIGRKRISKLNSQQYT